MSWLPWWRSASNLHKLGRCGWCCPPSRCHGRWRVAAATDERLSADPTLDAAPFEGPLNPLATLWSTSVVRFLDRVLPATLTSVEYGSTDLRREDWGADLNAEHIQVQPRQREFAGNLCDTAAQRDCCPVDEQDGRHGFSGRDESAARQ